MWTVYKKHIEGCEMKVERFRTYRTMRDAVSCVRHRNKLNDGYIYTYRKEK
jgi:hypothetical protein